MIRIGAVVGDPTSARYRLRNDRRRLTRIGNDAAMNASQHWDIGSIRLTRVSYFDTPLPPEAVALVGLALDEDWMQPWVSDGMPAVGQAFWVVESAGTTIVVDPCGASDEFLRAGADAVTHQWKGLCSCQTRPARPN